MVTILKMVKQDREISKKLISKYNDDVKNIVNELVDKMLSKVNK